MQRISYNKVKTIRSLRLKGNSIPEIAQKTGIAKTTIQRYVKNISVPDEYAKILREKQGGSKQRAAGLRQDIFEKAESIIGDLSSRDRLFLLLGLYWGEGTKADLSMINSDPVLLQSFASCLQDFGITKDRIRLSLRVHGDVSLRASKDFWSTTLGIPLHHFGRIEVIDGKKKGKLPYGMCRIRVLGGVKERLLIQTAISIVGRKLSNPVQSSSRPRSSTDRTSAS